ncbi:MAG: glycosyltransferase family 2 protein [Cyclobacteriaceae bacterium]
MITFSIIIPVYQQVTHLREALESALNQTTPPLEVIVVDDGSELLYADHIREICTNVDGVQLIRIDQNQGVSHARNAGAKVAKGNYLIFLDADDLMDAVFLESCTNALAKNPADVLMGKSLLFKGELDQKTFSKKQKTYQYLTQKYHLSSPRQPSYISIYCPAIHGLVFKKRVFDRFHFNESLRYGEDRFLMLQLRYEGLTIVPVDLTAGYYRLGSSAGYPTNSKLEYVHSTLKTDFLLSREDRAYLLFLRGIYMFRIGKNKKALGAFFQGLSSFSALRKIISLVILRIF